MIPIVPYICNRDCKLLNPHCQYSVPIFLDITGILIPLGEECAHPERRRLFEKQARKLLQEDIFEGVISQPFTC